MQSEPVSPPPITTTCLPLALIGGNSPIGYLQSLQAPDGMDQGSRLSINQAVEAAQKSDAVIYCIDYNDPYAYGGGGFGISLGGGAVMLNIHYSYTPDGRRAKAKKPVLKAQNQWRSGRRILAERRMMIEKRQES